MTTTTSTATGREFLNAWPDRMREYGYTHISDNKCPRHLAGKRHRGWPDCWCTSSLNDHAATYERLGRRLVLWEPYQANPAELARVVAAATADGLDVMLSGHSPYNPGSTLGIEFTVSGPRENS